MRCISPYAQYSITVIEGHEQIITDARGYAQLRPITKAVIANFERSGLLDNEQEIALSKFTFSGLPEGVNPLTRVSVFDTESYCLSLPKDQRDEVQVMMDERLRELAEQHPSDFIVVDQPAVEKPWATYDDEPQAGFESKVEEILAFQSGTGINPENVYRYELENLARPEILEPMLRILDPEKATGLYGEVEGDEYQEPFFVQA